MFTPTLLLAAVFSLGTAAQAPPHHDMAAVGKALSNPVSDLWALVTEFDFAWTDELRSTLSFGYVNADLPGFFASDSLESNIYVAANPVWMPIGNLQFGFEYLYGRLENFDGSSADASRLLWSSKFTF